jgi:hypothetical protein
LREGAARRGAHRSGADGGDARTESGGEVRLRWQKTSEVDAWVMGTSVRCSGVDGRDKRCMGEKKIGQQPVAPFKGGGGQQRGGGGPAVGTPCDAGHVGPGSDWRAVRRRG